MYHKQLVSHVSLKISKGIAYEDIRSELVAEGWSPDDIQEAFYYSSHPEKLKHFSLRRGLRSEVSALTLIVTVLLVLVAASSIFFILRDNNVSYAISVGELPTPERVSFTYGEQPSLSNPDYFGKVKQQFIVKKADFIEADLSEKILRVYQSGNLALEVPIDSKGREGSWWETPAGLYEVESKEKAHFSGMGHVWMPWSMKFQGNFYIHGRTYYPDGTPTAKEFTGGCIRLSTENAEKVFNMIKTGTPVLVFEHSFSADTFQYQTEQGPTLMAPVYLSGDLRNNHIFASNDATLEVPIASITKLMTALIATEYINLDSVATVPAEAVVYTSKARLKPGMQYSIYQLLFPLLMESSNEAAETIARYYGRGKFIEHMNRKAVSIGMLHSHFADVSGASAENTSSAEDLFMLAKYIYNNRSFIFNITSGKLKANAYGDSGFADIGNYNDFISNTHFFGGKNGKTTAAAETSISVFEFPVGTTTRPVVTIVLGSPNAAVEAQKVIDYTLERLNK
jgi:hypothetical protein